jgi:hypothetical protein
MTLRTTQIHLGIAALLVALFLTFVAIPNWVTSPSNVRNIILSPTFWPYVLTALTALAGGLLLLTGLRTDPMAIHLDDDGDAAPQTPGAWIRLAVLAVLMLVTMVALSRLGMVWTAMLLFAATAFLFRTRHPVVAVVCAILVPLALYAFFAHVTSVAIPQGDYLRLP